MPRMNFSIQISSVIGDFNIKLLIESYISKKSSGLFFCSQSATMRVIQALLLFLSAALLSESFKNCILGRVASCRTGSIKLSEEEPSQAPESYEKNKDGSFSDKADVKATLSQLMAVLSPLAPSKLSDGVLSEEKLVQQVQDGFSKILEGVRESSMTPMEKRLVITEANIILSDMKTKEVTSCVCLL